MKRKIISIVTIVAIIVGMTNSYANQDIVRLNVVQESAKEEYFAEDKGLLTKKITSSDSEQCSVKIELSLENIAEEQSTEIVIVVDNSGSMASVTDSGEPRRDIIVNSMDTIINEVFDNTTGVKMGIVRFADVGQYLSEAAVVMSEITDDKDGVLQAKDNFDNLYVTSNTTTASGYDPDTFKKCEGGTNIDAGLLKASELFSEDAENKIVILLTDGVPTNAVGASSSASSATINNLTKQRLLTLEESGILTISLMAGMLDTTTTYQESIKTIFGTEEEPTAGKFYNVTDDNIENIVRDEIVVEVINAVKYEMNNIVIEDYFPMEIVENFNFSYIDLPNNGKITANIDAVDNNIVWTIDSLQIGEKATIVYELQLTDKQDVDDILNIVIPTNEKVTVEYTDLDGVQIEGVMEDSPKIELVEIENQEQDEEEQDEEEQDEEEQDEEEQDEEEQDEEEQDEEEQDEEEQYEVGQDEEEQYEVEKDSEDDTYTSESTGQQSNNSGSGTVSKLPDTGDKYVNYIVAMTIIVSFFGVILVKSNKKYCEYRIDK